MANLAARAPRAGDLLADRYDLLEEIERGGMGRVLRAHDRLLGRDVAVKILTHAGSADEDFRRACLREARAAAGLVHAGIATIFDTGVHDGQSFLVMELVPGRTLRALLLRRGRLPPDEAVAIAARVAEALDYAHRRGVLHCDVKPHNIIVTPAGAPKLVDFGLARAANVTRAFDTGEVYGSAPYLAPEQVRGGSIDARADVYALGVVLYEMLTGRPPFRGENVAAVLAQRLTVDPSPPRSLNPAISPVVERAVLTALAREPARRYPSAAAFAAALRELAPDDPAAMETQPLTMETQPLAIEARSPGRSRSPAGRLGTRPRAIGGNRLALGALALSALAVVLGFALLLAARPAARPSPPQAAAPPSVAAPPSAASQPPPSQKAELPGAGWATFTRRSCEWSSVTTPPAICFGERPAGFRVRIIQRGSRRWMIWDPETRNIAYVDAAAIRAD